MSINTLTNRYKDIDMAKGFAIVLMVLGHSYTINDNNFILIALYSFHMPFFFIVSGVLYGMQHEKSTLKFNFFKKSKSLLIPYIVWNSLYQLFLCFLNFIGGNFTFDILHSRLVNVLKFTGSALWFLPVMFLSQLIFLLTANKKLLNIILSVCLFSLGLFVPHTSQIIELFIRSFVGVGFMAIGYYGYKIYRKQTNFFIIIAILIIDGILTFSNGLVDFAYRMFGNRIIYVLTAVLGTYILLQVCMKFKGNSIVTKILQLWGNNSIIILCLHQFIIQILRLIDGKFFNNVLMSLGLFEGFVLMGLVMLLLTPVIGLINRFFGILFGKCSKQIRKTD